MAWILARWCGLTLGLAISACAMPVTNGAPPVSPSDQPSPTASPSPLPTVSQTSLTGRWYASDRALGSGSISVCDVYVRHALNLKQSGPNLQGNTYVFSATQVTRVFDEMESMSGTNNNGDVQMTGRIDSGASTGSSVTYSLKFDDESGHLIGTRNGQPVWLVPLRVENCENGSTSH